MNKYLLQWEHWICWNFLLSKVTCIVLNHFLLKIFESLLIEIFVIHNLMQHYSLQHSHAQLNSTQLYSSPNFLYPCSTLFNRAFLLSYVTHCMHCTAVHWTTLHCTVLAALYCTALSSAVLWWNLEKVPYFTTYTTQTELQQTRPLRREVTEILSQTMHTVLYLLYKWLKFGFSVISFGPGQCLLLFFTSYNWLLSTCFTVLS